MLSYIKGTITSIEGTNVIIETSNIGYLVKCPNPSSYKIGDEATIYTYLHLREDLIELYGFLSLEEKNLFLQLISVKGLGPKGALAILSSASINDILSAIQKADAKYLQRFPGIGAKASQQIILDLHGKINLNHKQDRFEDPKVTRIKEALKNMGYNNSELKAVTNIIEDNIDKNDSELIMLTLKALAKA